jgi:hypothetical protein
MSASLVDTAVSSIERVFNSEVGDPLFNVSAVICFVVWVLIARLFISMTASKRGIFAASFALIISFAFGVSAYSIVEFYVVPDLAVDSADWSDRILPWAGFGLFLLLSILLITKRILDLSAGTSIFIYLVATGAAVCAYFATQVTMGVLEFGEDKVQERDQRVNEELDSML